MKTEAKNRFKEALEIFIGENCKNTTVTYKVLVGKHYEEILKMADKWGADLIVVYHNHRRSINEAFSQDCAQKIVKNANCSVLRLRNVIRG